MKNLIKVGTRKSLLALKQTEMAAEAVKKKFPQVAFEIVGISTKGDRNLEKPLGEIGDKGLFVSEIEKMIKNGEIDFAVHSGKDLPLELYGGLEISGVLSRGDRRDVLVKRKNSDSIKVIGTGSKRRTSQCAEIFKDSKFRLIRGNINTRLEKLWRGEYDAVILAAAGLERLGLFEDSRFDFIPFEEEEMIPAACQGIIVMEAAENSETAELLRAAECPAARKEFDCERYILKAFGGDCSASIGASARYSGGVISCSVMYGNKKTKFITDEENFYETADRYLKSLL